MPEPRQTERTVRVGPITISCMDPDARDLMDRTIARFRETCLIQWSEEKDDGAYRFAYWLFRYSGLRVEEEAADAAE